MAPRATQQQRASQGGGGKKKTGGASQRAARANSDDEGRNSEEDEEEEEEEEDEEMEDASATQKKEKKKPSKKKAAGGASSALSPEELDRCAEKIVRMALFKEPKRDLLKRADILTSALKGHTKSFNAAFAAAQKILRKTFGMEMVETMTRTERDNLGDEKNDEGGKKKAAGSSKLYIVRSCLDAKLIRAATTQDNELQEAEMDDLVDRGLATDKDEIPDRPLGTLLAWKNMEPMALTGVLQLVLCLILVNGRSLPEPQLKNQLKSFHLHWNSTFPLAVHHTDKQLSLEGYLEMAKKQSMLDKVRVAAPGAGATQTATQNRRKSRMDDEGGEMNEWKWGPRAHAEISETTIAQFMTDFMRNRWFEDQRKLLEEDEEDDAAAQAGSKKKAKDKVKMTMDEKLDELKEKADKYAAIVYRDILRAAGGALTEIKEKEAILPA